MDDSPQPALYPIKVDGLYGFIDATGRVVIKPQYSDVRDFTEGVAPVQVDAESTEGFIDASGALVLRTDGLVVDSFSEGLAAAW